MNWVNHYAPRVIVRPGRSRIPYAIPHIFSGPESVHHAGHYAVLWWLGLSLQEKGLGYFIQFSTSFFKIPQAFAGLIFLAVVSLVLFKSVQWAQQWLYPWSIPKNKR